MTACVCDGRMSLISLFDGIGGFPLAFSRAGVRTVATVEIDKAAAGVAADHFPEAKHFPDVTEVTPDELLATGFCPVHGVVSAGWPCTDLSLAGLRLGLGGARSGLVGEVFRLLVGLRPRWFVLENVPGLLSSVCPCPGGGICDSPACSAVHTVRGGACGRAIRGGRLRGPGRCMALHGGGMGTVLRRLGECGYGLAYRVLDAQHFGVPQRRRRVVIVGHLGDAAGPAQVLLEPESGSGHPAPGRSARAGATRVTGRSAPGTGGGVAPTLQGGGKRGYRVDAEMAAGGRLVTAATTTLVTGQPEVWQQQGSKVLPMGTMRRGNGNVAGGVPFLAHALTAEVADASEDGTDRRTPLVPVDLAQVTSGTNRSNPRDGDRNGTLAAGGRPAIAFGHTNGIDPQASEHVAPTMRAGHNVGGGADSTPTSVRRLTPVECERLQGYPDGWTATSHGRDQADSPRYRQLGNSIAVPVFEWVTRRLVTVERGEDL